MINEFVFPGAYQFVETIEKEVKTILAVVEEDDLDSSVPVDARTLYAVTPEMKERTKIIQTHLV